MPRPLLPIGLFTAALLLSACGSRTGPPPDEAGFNRCFDIDFNPEVSMEEKSACWRGWLDSPGGRTTDDKIRYAETRRMELARGKALPGSDYPGSAPHRPRLFDTEVFNREPSEDAGAPDSDSDTMTEPDNSKSTDEDFAETAGEEGPVPTDEDESLSEAGATTASSFPGPLRSRFSEVKLPYLLGLECLRRRS